MNEIEELFVEYVEDACPHCGKPVVVSNIWDAGLAEARRWAIKRGRQLKRETARVVELLRENSDLKVENAALKRDLDELRGDHLITFSYFHHVQDQHTIEELRTENAALKQRVAELEELDGEFWKESRDFWFDHYLALAARDAEQADELKRLQMREAAREKTP